MKIDYSSREIEIFEYSKMFYFIHFIDKSQKEPKAFRNIVTVLKVNSLSIYIYIKALFDAWLENSNYFVNS